MLNVDKLTITASAFFFAFMTIWYAKEQSELSLIFLTLTIIGGFTLKNMGKDE